MDENFASFLEDFGPGIEKRHVPPSSVELFRGKLPDQMLRYWIEHGWCGYADGLFWTVNPQEYEHVLLAWIGDTQFVEQDVYHVIARSAFGKLHLWGEESGNSLFISAPCSYCIPTASILIGEKMNFGVQVFFGGMSRQLNDFDGMFNSALNRLGRLKPDEMYGFVPALVLGGEPTVNNLQKVKAIEHLTILAQLAPLDIITSPPM